MIQEAALKVASRIDHTNIDKNATEDDIIRTCNQAKQYRFRGVDIRPQWVSFVKNELRETNIKVIVLIDDPMGLSSHEERMVLCRKAKDDGADELDVVMNIVDLKYERYDKILADLKEIAAIAPTKVIIGSGYLTDKEISKASQLVKQSGAICVKTATDKDPLENRELGEKAENLKIMKENAQGLLIKASGSIRSYEDYKMMLLAGADIIGTSSGLAIMEGFYKTNSEK
jgi:deoxyribose-phosphate aldolase